MNIPGFTAETSLVPTTTMYRGEVGFSRSALGAAHFAFAAQALRDSAATPSRRVTGALRAGGGGGGGSGFACDTQICRCRGADDCIDLWVNTGLCDPSGIYCSDDTQVCFCARA